jgi:hypothetical protein
LNELSVALLNVLDGTILGLHLTGALLQMEAHVRACHCDLLKQRAHVLGVLCGKRSTRMVGRKLGVVDGGHTLTPHRITLVLNGEQGNGGVTENRQVALIELCEGLVGSPLQSVVEVVTPSRGKPSHLVWVGGVSQNVHMDLSAPQPKLKVQMATVRGTSRSRVRNPGRCNPSQRNHPSALRVA